MKEYLELLRHVMDYGEPHEDRTGVGTRSVFGHQLRIDMRKGFPLVTTRQIPFRWIAEELRWMIAGSTSEPELAEKGVMTWAPWATLAEAEKHGRPLGDLGPTYGWLLRNFGGVYMPTEQRRLWQRLNIDKINGHDQLWELCYLMDTEPYSRRHVVCQWDPVSVHELTIPPCHPLWQVRIHGRNDWPTEGMSLHVYARSQDAFIGLPFDIAHFGLLLELLAWATCRIPMWLIMSFGDLHIYLNHLEGVDGQLSRAPKARPVLRVTKQMWHAEPPAPGQDTFTNLLQLRFSDLSLTGYDSWPSIKLKVAV